jgi:pteridine reductase
MEHSKVVLVTGSGRHRIGNVVARSLAERGYSIALHYNSSADAAQATAEQIRETGVPCEAFRADVAVESEVNRMFDQAMERFGQLDVLVTTASVWSVVPLEQVTADDVLQNFRVNTLGTFLCARRAGMIMAAQADGGVIVTIGDWAIHRPYIDHAPYFVSKGAIPTMTRTLAVELGHRNPRVRVNCIHPGPVMFPPDSTEQERQEMLDSTLVHGANQPETIASAVSFFIDNEFVTGVCLPVDGGRSIYSPESKIRSRPI